MPDPRRIRFERLTLPMERDLYFAALALTGQESDALDLVQEAYLRAYRAFDTYRTDENIKGWIFTILRNAYVDFCRKKKRQSTLLDLAAQAAPEAPPAELLSLEDTLPEDILRVLNGLSPAHRVLVQLADLQRLTYKEISEILGCPIGSVMSGLHHARNRLRSELEKTRARTKGSTGAPA